MLAEDPDKAYFQHIDIFDENVDDYPMVYTAIVVFIILLQILRIGTTLVEIDNARRSLLPHYYPNRYNDKSINVDKSSV